MPIDASFARRACDIRSLIFIGKGKSGKGTWEEGEEAWAKVEDAELTSPEAGERGEEEGRNLFNCLEDLCLRDRILKTQSVICGPCKMKAIYLEGVIGEEANKGKRVIDEGAKGGEGLTDV
eukprot:11194511-Karenia_brevis.AAC.1